MLVLNIGDFMSENEKFYNLNVCLSNGGILYMKHYVLSFLKGNNDTGINDEIISEIENDTYPLECLVSCYIAFTSIYYTEILKKLNIERSYL